MFFFTTDTYEICRMHKIWQMSNETNNITAAMNEFMFDEIKCSSYNMSGLTNCVVHDIPRFLLLTTTSANPDCINMIDDADTLFIRPSFTHSSFEYNVQTMIIVLEEDDIIYLRKTQSGYSSYNKNNHCFEPLHDFSTQHTRFASRWTIFVYETYEHIFYASELQKISFDQTGLTATTEPDDYTMDTVDGLLPLFTAYLNVGPIRIRLDDIKVLLDKQGDLNDLIINAHLFVTATAASLQKRVLAVQSYVISEIIQKRLKRITTPWLDYDIILCPINQKHHWYIIIIDIQRKIIVEFDSLPTHDLPRTQNMNRLLHVLGIQHKLKTQTPINFEKTWKFCTPSTELNLLQKDSHSCGLHLLIQTKAYINQQQLTTIPTEKIHHYRYQVAEEILRKADPISPDSSSSSVSKLYCTMRH